MGEREEEGEGKGWKDKRGQEGGGKREGSWRVGGRGKTKGKERMIP